MQTIITMKYNEKSSIPLMYAERYGIIHKEIRRENENIFINIPIDECVTDGKTISIIKNILSNILRAEPVDCYVTDDVVESNSLMKIELALVDCYMKKSYERHYSKRVRNFYKKYGISIDGYLPQIEYKDDDSCVLTSCADTSNKKTSVVRNFSFEYLYDVCELYRNFSDGKDLIIDD